MYKMYDICYTLYVMYFGILPDYLINHNLPKYLRFNKQIKLYILW